MLQGIQWLKKVCFVPMLPSQISSKVLAGCGSRKNAMLSVLVIGKGWELEGDSSRRSSGCCNFGCAVVGERMLAGSGIRRTMWSQCTSDADAVRIVEQGDSSGLGSIPRNMDRE